MKNWKICRCGRKMKVTNTWTDKSRLECEQCGCVRHVQHQVLTEVVKLILAMPKK